MSRKVTRTIHAAFLARKRKTVGNTSTDGDAVYLHGNKIVNRNPASGEVFIRTAGWNTPTTRERLKAFTTFPVYQKRGQLYIGENAWDGDWISATNP
jgi:hypothetical protein